jgi:hypothetical protein
VLIRDDPKAMALDQAGIPGWTTLFRLWCSHDERPYKTITDENKLFLSCYFQAQ